MGVADSIIRWINNGGVLTMKELERFIRKVETDAREDESERTKQFYFERLKAGRTRRLQRKDKEFGDLLIEIGNYLYIRRRIRNGQEVREDMINNYVRTSSFKRFAGKERIKV